MSHAERVRFGLTTSTPMPPKPQPYNPDAKINAEQRRKNAEALRGKLDGRWDNQVRTFSAWELEELRRDLQLLNTTRADRFVTLIDEHQAFDDYREQVGIALTEANVEGLVDYVSDVEDSLKGELVAKDDEINELLSDNPDQSPAQLVTTFRLWHAKELERLKKHVTDEIATLRERLETAKTALEPLG